MLSDNLLIEESDQLRRMDVGEVMEVFQGFRGRRVQWMVLGGWAPRIQWRLGSGNFGKGRLGAPKISTK